MNSKALFVAFLVLLLAAATAIPQRRSRLLDFRRQVESLYRDPTKKELNQVTPDQDLKETYTNFLKQADTGLTKLVFDAGCAENTNVISVERNCLKYTMPGGGSSYSFRVNKYRISRLADITFTINSFQATGALLHGIFVNLGDISLDQITLETRGLGFLRRYEPPVDYQSAKRADFLLSKGLLYDGFIYRRALFIKEETTFALRSIAFRGRFYKSAAGFTYNEFDFDKRRDLIVVFRIVRKHRDGSVTILWRVLRNKKSPKLAFKKA